MMENELTTTPINEESSTSNPVVSGNSASALDEATSLKTRLKETENRLKELEAYKQGIELKELRQGLYQKYMFTEEDQKIADTLITNHKIKNHQAFIDDFYNHVLKPRTTQPPSVYPLNANRSSDTALAQFANQIWKAPS